jgi:hypothetical protein
MIGNYVSYGGYIESLFLITGIMILLIDARTYRYGRMKKEHKAAVVSGWINIAFCVIFFAANRIFKTWFW